MVAPQKGRGASEQRGVKRKKHKDVEEWTLTELTEQLTERYSPTTVPPCSLCGRELQIARIGGGPTRWACSGYEDDPKRPGQVRMRKGRAVADDHYTMSMFVDPRQGGDVAVMEAVRRLNATTVAGST